MSPQAWIVQQEAFGLHWTRRYPLEQVHDLHIRYNPVLEKSLKHWELIFDRKAAFHIVSYPMTLPEGQRIKEAIYSRFRNWSAEALVDAVVRKAAFGPCFGTLCHFHSYRWAEKSADF